MAVATAGSSPSKDFSKKKKRLGVKIPGAIFMAIFMGKKSIFDPYFHCPLARGLELCSSLPPPIPAAAVHSHTTDQLRTFAMDDRYADSRPFPRGNRRTPQSGQEEREQRCLLLGAERMWTAWTTLED